MFYKRANKLDSQRGSISLFFLAFVLIIIALVSVSLFVGSRVHHQIKVDQAADSAARAGAAHQALGLNVIAVNNLAIASSLQINHSLVLMAYYGGALRAALYDIVDTLDDTVEAFTEVMNFGHQIQADVFDRFNKIGAIFYKSAQGMSTYNQKIRDNWVYLSPIKAMELGRLNDPGAIIIPSMGKTKGLPFDMSRFKYSPTSSTDVGDKLLYTTSSYDAICLTSALAVPNADKHDAMIEWISGPLKTIDELDAVTAILDIFQKIIENVNKFAPIRFGLMECGIALKSSIFDILDSGSSWAVGVVGAWGKGITEGIVDTWSDFFITKGQPLCDIAYGTYAVGMSANAAFVFADSDYKDKVPISLRLKMVYEKFDKNRVELKEQFTTCFPESKTIERLEKVWDDCPDTHCCHSCGFLGCCAWADTDCCDDPIQKLGVVKYHVNIAPTNDFYNTSICQGLREDLNIGSKKYMSNYWVEGTSTVVTGDVFVGDNISDSIKDARIDNLLKTFLPYPTIAYSSRGYKECKIQSDGSYPAGCNNKFRVRSKSYICPFKDLINKFIIDSCSFNLTIFGHDISHKVEPQKHADIEFASNPNYMCDEYDAFAKTATEKNEDKKIGTQLISWGQQAKYHRKINGQENKDESNMGFMVINKAKRKEFYDNLNLGSVAISPIWNASEFDSLKACTSHSYSMLSDVESKRCTIELYRHIGFGAVDSDGSKTLELVSGGQEGFFSGRSIFSRSQWSFAKYKPVYVPMQKDQGSGKSFQTHVLTLWPAWTVSPATTSLAEFIDSSSSFKGKLKNGFKYVDWLMGNRSDETEDISISF